MSKNQSKEQDKIIVERITSLINSKNIMGKDFATAIGVTPSTISEWKANRQSPISHINKIADYFEVSVDYLLGRTDDPSPYPNQNLNIPQDIANVQFAFYDGDKDELTQEDIDDIAKYVRYMREKRRKENESKK